MLKIIKDNIGFSFKSKALMFKWLIDNDLSIDTETSKPEYDTYYVCKGIKVTNKAKSKPIPLREGLFDFNKRKGYKVIKLRALKRK